MTVATATNDGGNDGSDSDSDVAFASMDFAGVNFEDENVDLSERELEALTIEQLVLFGQDDNETNDECREVMQELYKLISCGQYREALKSPVAQDFFSGINGDDSTPMAQLIQGRVVSFVETVNQGVEVELLAVAAFNLFLQLNYTGPSLEKSASPTDDTPLDPLANVNPHPCFQSFCTVATEPKRDDKFHNKVLSELAVDGEWPCQVCQAPYLLLLARSILHALARPQRPDWMHAASSDDTGSSVSQSVPPVFVDAVSNLKAIYLWNARAAVAHERLLVQTRDASVTLWDETKESFQTALSLYCEDVDTSLDDNWIERKRAATVVLEWGLAHFYFNRPDQARLYFHKAMEYSGLQVEMTGAVGKRTKYQQESKAQMLVRATSVNQQGEEMAANEEKNADMLQSQMIEHGEDGILLEKVKFDDEKENIVSRLSILDQAILLSLCLDVKNNNPADGLTGEQMGAYLARVLDHHDDWMVYSTALLERAWLEYERSQGRERAILQIQALVDQHSNRLTITQSTFESVEDSAPPQERLLNLHSIVYPPRWAMLQDLAERYAKLGIVTTAAELFQEIEQWDEVVECFRHAGKVSQAENVVRERLSESETPRMWAALGDLTNDPSHYRKALELSNGRYSDAFVALGKHHFDKGELEEAAEYYSKGLKIRPLMPHVWFRLGAISMRLGRWKEALNAFSEVVQQEPEEADAWANVAAVHMHNKMPAEAYPALNEVCSIESI
jgi:tetratricopeptide (TPR) repeat protein